MSSSHKTTHHEGFVNNNPGIVAALVATGIAVGFVYVLYAGAHAGGGHAAPHGSGSAHAAGSAAQHAPAAGH